ncbi:hypothetical protein DESC_690050 [Desulfosarcina cetonica]|nr:hypothetical protein DESC_690050 [Desulfosarcina cetonica]
MGPVETGQGIGLDRLFDHIRNLLELFISRLVNHAEGKYHPAIHHAFVIADTAFQKIRIGEDQLLTGKTAQAGGFEAHMLDRAHVVVDDDEIVDDEGLVQDNGKGSKKIAENVLDGQGHGDTADAQTGDQGGDVDAQVVEAVEQQKNPDEHAQHESHRRQGGDRTGITSELAFAEARHPERHGMRRKNTDLDQGDDPDNMTEDAGCLIRQRELEGTEIHRHGEDKDHIQAFDQFHQKIVPHRYGPGGESGQLFIKDAFGDADGHVNKHHDADADQPFLQRILINDNF